MVLLVFSSSDSESISDFILAFSVWREKGCSLSDKVIFPLRPASTLFSPVTSSSSTSVSAEISSRTFSFSSISLSNFLLQSFTLLPVMHFVLVVVVDEFLVLMEEQVEELSGVFLCFPGDPAWMVFDCLLFCPGSSVEIGGETMAGDEKGWTLDRSRACSNMFPPV